MPVSSLVREPTGQSPAERALPVGGPDGTTPGGISAQARAATAAFASYLKTSESQAIRASKTPISSDVAGDAIAKAFEELTGEPLGQRGRAILTAQWAHETGHGASMYNFNFGGLKGVGPSGLSVVQRTREGYGANERQISDRFRAYQGVDEGAKDYVGLLLLRYGQAVDAAKQGDVAGFVRGLKQRGYFTGDPVAYEKSVASIAERMGADRLTDSGALTRSYAEASSSSGFPRGVLPGIQERHQLATNQSAETLRSQLESRHLAALMIPPQPTAMLVSGGASSESVENGDGIWGESESLSAISATLMADEVSRSALELASSASSRPRVSTNSNTRR